jgi:YesN/AraC family two-component response regulator
MVDKKIRVLIIDDHTIVRTGIRLLLNSQPDMEAIGEAENGNIGLALAKEIRPDVIIMDINMPDMDGISSGINHA